MPTIATDHYTLDLLLSEDDGKLALRLSLPGRAESLTMDGPTFPIEGIADAPASWEASAAPVPVFEGVTEHRFTARWGESLRLEIVARVAEASPVIRFRYTLSSDTPLRLTKLDGRDALTYASLSLPEPQATEVRFSEFSDLFHSFLPTEFPLKRAHFAEEVSAMGPLLAWPLVNGSALFAYEHGSQLPDAFLEYRLSREGSVSFEQSREITATGRASGRKAYLRRPGFKSPLFRGVRPNCGTLTASGYCAIRHPTAKAGNPTFSTTPGTIRSA